MKTTPHDIDHAARTIGAVTLFILVGSIGLTLGLLLTLTVIGAIVGVPLMFLSFLILCLAPFAKRLTRAPQQPPPLPK